MQTNFIDTSKCINLPYIFNAAIFEYRSVKYLAYRANKNMWTCSLYICRTDDNWNPIEIGHKLNFPVKKFRLYEDPRFVLFNNIPYLAVCEINQINHCQSQLLIELTDKLKIKKCIKINYGDNLDLLQKQAINKPPNVHYVNFEIPISYEKNWTFFEDNKKLHFIYNTQPICSICTLNDKFQVAYESLDRKLFSWPFGTIRGGALCKVDDIYYHFFHSSEKLPIMQTLKRPENRIYFIGCYTFRAIYDDFELLQQSRIPLEVGNILEDTPLWDNCAVFPCGAMFENNEFKISYGWNDFRVKLLTISKTELDSLMIPLE